MSCFLICGAIFVVAAYFFREIVVKGQRCTSDVKLHGKTAIVTGSNTGIGKRTAVDLAKRGARVIMACRSRERGEAAMEDVKRESGSSDVVFMSLDLASLKSVRSFAENFLKSEPRLDLLINNAGHCFLKSAQELVLWQRQRGPPAERWGVFNEVLLWGEGLRPLGE